MTHFTTSPIRMLATSIKLLALAALPLAAAPLNVRDFGARGDGRTDDTSAIMAAVAEARDSAEPVVYFPAGTYRYSRHIDLDSVHVEGAGTSATIFEATNNAKSAWVLIGDAPGIRNVTIRTATKPTKRATEPETAGVHVADANHFLIDRVNVQDTASAGIIVRRSGGNRSQYARISNCVIKDTLADGIHLTRGSHYIEVVKNDVSGVGDDMIAVVSYRSQADLSHHVRIVKNVVHNNKWGRGITVVGGVDVLIAENTIRRASGAGVYLASEIAYDTFGAWRVSVLNNLLEDCVVTSSAGHGSVMIFGRPVTNGEDNRTGDILVSGNTIRGAGRDGIWCSKYTANVSLTRNVIENVTGNGIRVGDKAAKVTIAGNTVNGAGSSGLAIWNDCDAVRVLDDPALGGANQFSNCGEYGIWVNATGGKNALDLVGSHISSINQRNYGGIDGIKVSGKSSNYVVTVTDNRLSYTSKQRIDKVWESDITPIDSTGNSKIVDNFVPVYLQ